MESRFWLDDIGQLFSSPSLVPVKSDNLEVQMNSMTRLVIMTFVVCCLFSVHIDYRFLIGALLLIILAYYGIRALHNEPCKEYYGLVSTVVEPVPPVAWNTGTNDFVFTSGQDQNRCGAGATEACFTLPRFPSNPQLVDTGQTSAWCPQGKPLEETISVNQSLVGPPNPKTLVRPVIPTPIYDFEVWKPNDFIIPSGINDQRRQEMYDNGYVPIQQVAVAPPMVVREGYSPERENGGRGGCCGGDGGDGGGAVRRIPIEQVEVEAEEPQRRENYRHTGDAANPYKTFTYPSIDGACGYDPINLDYNLPINYKANKCQKTELMKEYNKNLFTIPLQPGLYTRSQVNQPYASQSNLGISMTQPLLPTALEKNKGYDSFVELARPLPPVYEPFPKTSEPLRTEIYDPRLTGYGTSYRSYLEPMTGQTRFYYDDVDQQTRTGYLTRNKIDFAAFGTTAGPVTNTSLQGNHLTGYADQTYSDSQVTFRNEMQQRLMHKNSNREWQQRIAPISTNNFARAGGGKNNSGGSYAGPRG